MDPLSVVALAGNILQFVQFTHALLNGTTEILRSTNGEQSRISESQDLANLVRQRIQAFAQKLNESAPKSPSGATRGGGNDNRQLKSLCESCCEVAEKLSSLLDSLKVKGNHGSLNTWEALYRAMQGEWKKERIQDLETRLHRISQELYLHAQEYQINKILGLLHHIDEENTRLETSRSEDIQRLHRELQEQRVVEKTNQHSSSVQATWECLSEVCMSCHALSTEQKILRSLKFVTIDDRHSRIARAHAKTFEWIFSPQHTSSSDEYLLDVNFAEWLRSVDQPMYWISGRPGSGKSTLMKYLFHHHKTREILKEWAGEYELDIVGYFFWAAASNSLQKSQEGLLRSVLYHILRKRPDQIRNAFPKIWSFYEEKQNHTTENRSKEFPFESAVTDVPNLLEAFSKISNSLDHSKFKMFFVIDGLDEYEGNPKEIIALLDIMRVSVNLKFCLASRSWREFEEAYGTDNPWRLYIHELTQRDIARYVYDKFEQDKRFRRLRENDESCPDLVQDIVDSARGVFLWVYLVVESLLDGLTNGDRTVDLQERLRELPTNLNELFERILDSISPFYRERSAEILTVANTTVLSLPLMTYWYIDQNYACDSTKVDSPSRDKIMFRLDQMRYRLNTLSKGLLEAPKSLDESLDPYGYCSFLGLEVNFLHRTVADYLRKPRTKAKISHWAENGPETNLTICKGIVAHVLAAPTDSKFFQSAGSVTSLLHTFYTHAFWIPRAECYSQEERICLQGMESALLSLERSTGMVSIIALPSLFNNRGTISPPLVPLFFGLTRYITSKSALSSIQQAGRKVLEMFILNDYRPKLLTKLAPQELAARYEEMLQSLLEAGCSPNEKVSLGIFWSTNVSHGSVWTVYLAKLLGSSERRRLESFGLFGGPPFPVIQKMLKFGASLDDHIPTDHNAVTVWEALRIILTPKELDGVRHFWETRNDSWSKKHKLRFWRK